MILAGFHRNRVLLASAMGATLWILHSQRTFGNATMRDMKVSTELARRAARKALLWEDEVYNLVAAKTALTELDGIGPFLADRLMEWFEKPPPPVSPPPLRAEFLTLARARRVLAKHGDWRASLQGELHTHTLWSDGSATIGEMGRAAKERGYQYLSITDHTQGLKIANGLSEILIDGTM